MNLDEFTNYTKITTENISRIKTGKHGPSTQQLESLAYVFGMKMYQLVALAEGEKLPVAPPKYDFAGQALLQNFRSMTSKEQELFMIMGERLAKLGATPQ